MTTTDPFRVLRLSEAAGQDFLRGILKTGKCIPLIGAGFTAGETAHRGKVPSGAEFMLTMRNAINASPTADKPSASSLDGYSFQKLADEYFREPIVDLAQIKSTLRDQFTGVSITSEVKKDFLRWDWEYFYTLNIDDAIERERNAIKVLPFTDFEQHKTTQFVYKLHGDAADAITAESADAMKLVFGSADYISSLIKNRALISTLTNDLVERHLLFVGCSLTEELDILFALAQSKATAIDPPIASRVYVTSNEPMDYEARKKLRQYGITDVLVVEYPEFYAFVASVDSPRTALTSALDPYKYPHAKSARSASNAFLQYLLQTAWKNHDDPLDLAVPRDGLERVSSLLTDPIAVLWGRRFSGRTTFLFEILSRHSNRRRYFVPSSAAASDQVLSTVLRSKDSLIAIDSGAMSYEQMQFMVRKIEQIRENNTTVVLATNRASLSALGALQADSTVEVEDRMSISEARQINAKLEPYGISKTWQSSVQHLENIFSISESPVVYKQLAQQSRLHSNITRLHTQWAISPLGKLEFSMLFYLGSRQRIYSRYFRELAKAGGLDHLGNSHFIDFARKWEPFVELEESDISSMRSERSMQVIVANSNAWIHYSIQQLSQKLGAVEAASQIVHTFTVMNLVEDKAFELLLFDNLNVIFADSISSLRFAVIREVYERLASHLSSSPDYWLQRAKGLYYLSNNADDLLVGVEYCEKSIVQRATKTSTNAKLTKANLLGKICKVAKNASDFQILRAVEAYVEAIESRAVNQIYIDELLRKSKTGRTYMSLVCRLARKQVALLPHKHSIEFIESYIAGRL
jgi:hypothetical protein